MEHVVLYCKKYLLLISYKCIKIHSLVTGVKMRSDVGNGPPILFLLPVLLITRKRWN